MASPTLELIRRDSRTLKLSFIDVSVTPNVAVNITGCTVFFTVKYRLSDADASALISKTITAHSNPTVGQTLIPLTTADMDIPEGLYYYDFQLKDDSGGIASTKRGVFSVVGDVTIRTS